MDNELLLDRVQNLLLGMEERVDGRFQAMEERIDGKLQAMEGRIDGKFQAMEERIDARLVTLDRKVDSVRAEVKLHNELLAPFITWEPPDRRRSDPALVGASGLAGATDEARKSTDALSSLEWNVVVRH